MNTEQRRNMKVLTPILPEGLIFYYYLATPSVKIPAIFVLKLF